MIATVAGAAIFIAAGLLLSGPYMRVADAHPGAHRTPADVERSPARRGLPRRSRREPGRGGATSPLRDGLENIPEKTLFPGLVILVLAVAGLSSSAYPRGCGGAGWGWRGSVLASGSRRAGAAVAVPGRLRAAAGVGGDQGSGEAGRHSPHWGLRCWPGRARSERCWATRRGEPGARGDSDRRPPGLGSWSRDGGFPSTRSTTRPSQVPPEPPSVGLGAAPQLHLPAERATTTAATCCGRPTGSRRSSTGARASTGLHRALIERMRAVPRPAHGALLSRLGVSSVILHANRVEGTPWEGAARRPVARPRR